MNDGACRNVYEEVMNEYEVVIKGRDQQLETAMAALLKQVRGAGSN